MTHSKILTAAIVVVAAAAATPARADDKTEIRAVTYDDDGGLTRVRIRGDRTPTFTVYKLERPTRVVIDVPRARLAESLRGHEGASTFSPNTWAVSTIAAQQLDDGGSVVRVIVALARPGRYDVKTEGKEVVVMVTSRDPAPKLANPEALLKAQQETEQAKRAAASAEQARVQAERSTNAAQADAAKAKDVANAARSEAERLRKTAAEQTARAEAAQRAADDARRTERQASAADVQRAKQLAQAATADAANAKLEAGRAKAAAAAAQRDADRMKDAATAAQKEADRMRQLAEIGKRDAEAATELARKEARAAKAETEAVKATAAQDLARTKAQAEAAQATATRAKAEADAARRDVDTVRAEARADKQRAEAAVQAARAEAKAAKEAAAADKRQAVADKQQAETARREAEQMLAAARAQVASLDKKSSTVQALEDKARAAHAAAQAREEAARELVAKAARERQAAETAAKQAAAERDRSTARVATDRDRIAAEAKATAQRLTQAKLAAQDAEARRAAAEAAATAARRELDQTRTNLATIEQQRAAAEVAVSDAARRRGEAEAAASEASRRRTEAEQAAAIATKQRAAAEKQRSTADAERIAAEQAARDAKAAAVAADRQREIAERATRTAVTTKQAAEAGLAELTARRAAAERAAAAVEARSKAEAKARVEVAAAQARRATDAELARARAEATRLAAERARAETDLADRRKAVADQRVEAERLKHVAAQASEAAQREETRRSQLAQQRATEEQELASLKARRAAAATVAQAPAAKPASKPVLVRDISFSGDDHTGQVAIAVGGDATVKLGEVTPTHVELIIDRAELAPKLERKLDVTRFGGPVRAVSSFRDRRTPNRVRLIAELSAPVTPKIDRDANGVRWQFAGSTRTARAHAAPVVGGFGAASTPIAQQSVSQVPPQGGAGRNRKVYRGATVDLEFKDAPMHDLLRAIADTGKINIVVPDGIDPKVTVRLKRVPWDQALEVILASHQLWYRRDGNLYRVAPRKELDAEDDAEAARREAAVKAEAPRSEVVPLNYASATELKPKLEGMLSPKGKLEVDERTNALIINDVGGNREQIAKLALGLDTQTPQISIEARIVEARSDFRRQIGVQWGGRALAGAGGGNATGLIFPSSVGLVGGNEDQNTVRTGVAAPSDFAVNLPAQTGSGAGGALGLSLGSVGGNVNINLRLSALEDSGTIRIISAPKITVLNNKEARISQGVSIPISVVSANGTQTQFVQADLALVVTPYVSARDCAIAMNLNVTKNEPDFVNVGARGDPTITRKEAKTSILVNDGETSVLGGIYTRNSGVAYSKVPLFGDIPVLGWLFKNRRENDNRTEILVFVTPRITNKALLRCQ
ncbi:MAG: type IV pilus secretin PilQ [Kofleriaceae bacterium]